MDNARIVTLDPSGSVGRIVRGALELLNMKPIQIDTPDEESALYEIDRGATMLIIAADLAGESAMDLAFRISTDIRELAVVVIAEEGADVADDLPYVMLRRAHDAVRLVKAIEAALTYKDVRAAVLRTGAIPIILPDNAPGVVPGLDLEHVRRILDTLLVDVGALACVLGTRTGELVIERGALQGIERIELVSMLAPILKTGRDVKELLGGQLSTIQFFDGEEYDVFVLSAGMHHFLCVIYDGNSGSRQFGSVNRFGRRAAEDIIALVGANAFIWQAPRATDEVLPARTTMRVKPVKIEAEETPLEIPLAKAELNEVPSEQVIEAPVVLDPIENLDLDALFGDAPLNAGDADALFDLDALEDLSKSVQQTKGKLNWDQAKEIGLIS